MNTVALLLLAAMGYALATIGMKLGATSLGLWSLTLIIMGFGGAVAAELVILRHVDLGIVYILILAFETLLVLCYAASIGEPLTTRHMLGGAMVGLGLVVILR